MTVLCTKPPKPSRSLTKPNQTRLAYSRAWHVLHVGTDGRPLGRLASQIALVLMGKHKPIWNPSTDCGDYVVALGCNDIHTTGNKRFQKKYYSHSTRPGSLKAMTMDRMIEKWGGGEVLRRAVRGMLPKNRLRDDRMARFKCGSPDLRGALDDPWADSGMTGFEGDAHPYKKNLLKKFETSTRRPSKVLETSPPPPPSTPAI